MVLRTAAKVKTTSPQWMQPFTFGVKKPLGAAVNLKIFGLSERGRDALLGSAVLEIETLTPETEVRGSSDRSRTNGRDEVNMCVCVGTDAGCVVAVDDAQTDASGRYGSGTCTFPSSLSSSSSFLFLL